jgi:prepilin-type N-terminal cleavage/methylation domain-containing protein
MVILDGTMTIKDSSKERGFTLVELMIALVIVGILAGIGIPNFLNLKDKAIWGTAKANLIVIRSSLAGYAVDSTINKYPVGTFDFSELSDIVPKANLPEAEEISKFQTDTFSYACTDGAFYTISVNVNNRAFDPLTVTPNGIQPDSYEAYVR